MLEGRVVQLQAEMDYYRDIPFDDGNAQIAAGVC